MKKLFILIAAASLMAACAEDITTNQTDGDKRYITFSVSNEQNTSTRSVVAPWAEGQTEMADVEKKTVEVETDLPTEEPLCLTITDEPFIHHANSDITRGALLNSGDAASLSFGVSEFDENQNTYHFLNTVPAHQRTLDDGRELFKANEFWEYDSYDGVSYDFYAYAPKVDGTAQGITLHTSEGTDEEKAHCYRRITYNAADVNVGNQPDLMTAMKWSSSYVGAIPLNFQHRLCAIQIVTAGTWAAGYHVSGVQFTNVISSGTFDIDTDKDVAWVSYGSVGNYTVTGFNEASATGTTITGTVTPTSDERWLMLPPQTLDGAKLSITMSDNATPTPNSYTISAPIHASTWRAGHTVTYTVSPEAVSDLIVNYPTGSARSWNDGSNPQTGPVTTYTDADRFGLFVLDKDNNIFISNQCVSPIAGSDAASRTLNIPSLFKSKQFRYFLMYPYIDNASLEALVGTDNYNNYYKLDGTGRPANADAFFAEVIANWAPVNDQSTEATFKAQDLQIAKLSGDHFDMVHKMGLLACTLPDGITSNDVITYDGNSYDEDAEGEKWSRIDSKCTTMTWYASTTFTSSTDIPYKSGSTLYYVAKPGNATITMSTSSSTNYYDWSVSGASTTVSTANAYKTFTISPDLSNYYNKKVWEFSYSGEGKPWKAPLDGTYRMECWGASGGDTNFKSGSLVGRGGYVSGEISLTDETLYIYVGGYGTRTLQYNNDFAGYGGYNGGGGTAYTGCGGGGATDVRLVVDDLKSRIIVAGGGGGENNYNVPGSAYSGTSGSQGSKGGDAGGLRGLIFYSRSGSGFGSASNYGGSQTAGGSAVSGGTTGYNGSFGIGGNGYYGGGGGGWYGGSGGSNTPSGTKGEIAGGGGSSFISGYTGCRAVNSSTGAVLSDNYMTINGKQYIFSSMSMIDGGHSMSKPDGSGNETGHIGNGYCRITYTKP